MLMTPKHTLKLKMFNAEKLSHAIGVPANGDLTQKQIDSICFNVDRLFNNNYESLKAENEKLRGLLQRVIDVVYESEGVSGYHLNGDIASWGEFEVFNEIEQALNMTKLLLSLENAVKVG